MFVINQAEWLWWTIRIAMGTVPFESIQEVMGHELCRAHLLLLIACSANSRGLCDHLLEVIKVQLRCSVGPCFFGVWVALDEEGMHADGGGGFGELEGAVGSASGLFAGTWELGGVGDIEADWRGAEIGECGAVEFHHVGDTDEVVDEAVVAKECASLGEHDVFASCFGGFADWTSHFAGREELAFLDVQSTAVRFACLGRRDDQIGLPAQECRDLDEINGWGNCLGLFWSMDVGGGGDAEFLLDGSEVFEPLLDPDSSLGVDR